MSDKPTVTLLHGDNRDLLKGLPDNSIDAVVTDPPYGLVSIQKRFGKEGAAPAQQGADGAFARASRGFMGQQWDGTGIENSVEFWSEILRVLRPGGHLLSFGGTRTYHRMTCAIEDAGFEIRDCIFTWMYATGFPKSHNVSKALDRMAGMEREVVGKGPYSARRPRAEVAAANTSYAAAGDYGSSLLTAPATEEAKKWDGWGSGLKPSCEPIVLARKPLEKSLSIAANVLAHGTGAINIDGCRIPATDTRGGGFGLGKAPWEKGAVGGNSQYINGQDLGRWPANTIFTCPCEGDGHLDGCPVGELDRQSGRSKSSGAVMHHAAQQGNSMGRGYGHTSVGHADEGGASRFFFVAKPSPAERNYGCEELEAKDAAVLTGRSPGSPGLVMAGGKANPFAGTTGAAPRQNVHPTVKSISLMSHLVRLVCPPNGTVLDPFMGSGTTGMASVLEGFDFIGMEQSEEYHAIARCRVAWAQEQVVAKADAKKDLPLTLDFDAH